MKITQKKQNELVVWEYFIPKLEWAEKNDADLIKFFEWSEQGKHKGSNGVGVGVFNNSYFNALREGKSWAGIHMQMYEEGILDGSMPYFTILGGHGGEKRRWWQFWKKQPYKNKPIPCQVVDFMKKEMFKGIDATVIENCYQSLYKAQLKK